MLAEDKGCILNKVSYDWPLMNDENYIRFIRQGHVISNNVVFSQVGTQSSLCSLLLSLETPNDV